MGSSLDKMPALSNSISSGITPKITEHSEIRMVLFMAGFHPDEKNKIIFTRTLDIGDINDYYYINRPGSPGHNP